MPAIKINATSHSNSIVQDKINLEIKSIEFHKSYCTAIRENDTEYLSSFFKITLNHCFFKQKKALYRLRLTFAFMKMNFQIASFQETSKLFRMTD